MRRRKTNHDLTRRPARKKAPGTVAKPAGRKFGETTVNSTISGPAPQDTTAAGQVAERLDRIALRAGPRGYLAELHLGGAAVEIDAGALDSYAATRKAVLRRAGVVLALPDVEGCRRAADAREAWQHTVEQALAAGRAHR